MPKRVAEAVEEARAGEMFLRSPLRRGALSAGEQKAAETHVRESPDASSYHLLIALRAHAPDRYADVPGATKAKVLCDAMAKLVAFNDFGYLGDQPDDTYDGASAKALLEIGRPALPFLEKLLADQRDAPLAGSAEATASFVYKYRRADFAYRYIMLILGRKPTFHDLPEQRDRLIADLQGELKAKR